VACRRRGVGAAPVAVQKLTKARLLAQLRVLMQPEVIEAAAHLGSQMQQVRRRQEPCMRSPDALAPPHDWGSHPSATLVCLHHTCMPSSPALCACQASV